MENQTRNRTYYIDSYKYGNYDRYIKFKKVNYKINNIKLILRYFQVMFKLKTRAFRLSSILQFAFCSHSIFVVFDEKIITWHELEILTTKYVT